MYRPDYFIWLSGDNRITLDLFPLVIVPHLIQPSERKQLLSMVVPSVINSLEQIPVQQKNIAEQIGKTSSASVRDILLASIENLDNERKKLLQAKAELEQENANTLRNLEEELQDLEQYWEKYPVSKRIALINFLIQNEKEEAILREYFPEQPRLEVMRQLPNRSWESIRARAFKLNIERLVHWERQGYQKMTYDDMQFMQEHGIDEAARSTQWEPLYRRGAAVAGN